MTDSSPRPLPWPDLKIPPYRPMTVGPWTVRKYTRYTQAGYFREWPQGEGEVYVLLKNEEAWMSTTHDEVESNANHVAAARGHTMVMGAGMGVILYNLLPKPQVTRLTVVEMDPTVVELLKQSTDIERWPGAEKLVIEIADALKYRPSLPVDYMYVDIWIAPADPRALAHTQQMQRNVQAQRVSWWTQEIDFIHWLDRKGYGHASPTTAQYREWIDEIDLPLIDQDSPQYMATIPHVAQSHFYRTKVKKK